MKINCYKLSLLLCLFSIYAFNASAQYTQVTNTTGTQNYGGTNVTVTANGAGAQVYSDWCGAGPYWIGASDNPGSYTFAFSPAVTGVMFEFTAMNTGEILTITLNGQAYALGPCNVSDFVGTCGTSNTIIQNGVVTCPVDVPNGANGTLTICGTINSIEIANVGAGNGTVFNTHFTTAPCALQGGGGSVTAGSNSPLCQGETLNLTSTPGAVTYNWTGPNGFQSNLQNPTITNVTPAMAGDYIIEAIGACGTAYDTVTVQITPGPVISGIGSNSPVCEGQTLTFTTGAITNGVYSWTGPNSFTSAQQNPTIPGVSLAAAGTYTLTVSVNNCISNPSTITVDIDSLPPLPGVTDLNYCEGDPAVPLTATGVNLSWYLTATGGGALPGPPTPNTATAGATTYYVSSSGPGPTFCEGPRAPLTVTVYVHPDPPVIAYKNSYCANEAFEPFVVQVGQNILYYDAPVGGNVVGNPEVDPAAPGVYHWYATQTVNGCESDRFPITIIVHPYIAASFISEIRYGCTEDTVLLTNTSIGATSGYAWTFGDGFTDTAASPVHVYADQGIHNIQLISKAPYCRDTAEQTVDLNHPMSASFTADVDSICQHQVITFTNTSSATVINGVQPTFWWSFGDGTTSVDQNTSYTYDHPGSYIVQMIITDFVPCKDTAWMTIYVDSLSPLSIVTEDSMLCAGEATTFTADYSDIGLLGTSWEFGDGITKFDMNPARHTYEQPGTYNIKISTDYRICRDTSAELQIQVNPSPIIALGPDTSMCPTAGPLVLHDLDNAGNPAAKWLWNTGDRTFNISVKQPGRYSAEVEVNGCKASDSVWVKKDCYLDMPNAFSPDGDGLNDYFLPRQMLSEGVTAFKMQIFNRWGQEIFTTTKLDGRGWDGRFNGEPQPQGVYIYLVEVTFHNTVQEKKQGNVTLLR